MKTFIPEQELEQMGLHPYLYSYPKTIEQAEVLLTVYRRALLYQEGLHEPLQENRATMKHAQADYESTQQKLEDVAQYLIKYAPDNEYFKLIKAAIEHLPQPDKIPVQRDVKSQVRQRIEDTLTRGGFTNITKLTNEVFNAAKNPME